MASTNKTTNYELSQFVGSDKPAWLSDYNQDMSKIDAGIHSAKSTADGADGKADSNATAIGDITQLTTTNKTSLVSAVNEVNTLAGTAQETANTASTSASQAKTEADGIASYLTLSSTVTPTISANKGTVSSSANITVKKNSTNSLAKIYGTINVSNLQNSSGSFTCTIGDTGLRPSSAITFNGCATVRVENTSDHIFRTLQQSYTLNTDGTITVTFNNLNNTYGLYFMFIACVLFITDFGDIPTPE